MIKATYKESDFDYRALRPPQEVFNVKHSDHYIVHGTGKKAMRKIYYGVTWNDYERQKLKELYEELAKQNIQLPPTWKENETMRMIYDRKGNIHDAVPCLKQYMEFQMDPKWHTFDPVYQEIFDTGSIYVAGKDKQFRPIIVVSIYKLKLQGEAGEVVLRALIYALSMIKRNAFVPGYVENWVMIVEVNGAGLTNFPVASLKKFIAASQVYFSYCLDKLYITNPSTALNLAWNIVKGLIDPVTVEKMEFVKKSNFARLQANIDASQLEQKYGGTHENVTQFWPPVRFTKEPPYKTREEMIEEENEATKIRMEQEALREAEQKKHEENMRKRQLEIQTETEARNGEERKANEMLRSPSNHDFTQDVPFETTKPVNFYNLDFIIGQNFSGHYRKVIQVSKLQATKS